MCVYFIHFVHDFKTVVFEIHSRNPSLQSSVSQHMFMTRPSYVVLPIDDTQSDIAEHVNVVVSMPPFTFRNT